MPRIERPRTDAERDTALRTGKNRKDSVPPPAVIPYTAATIARLDLFQPAYRAKYLAVANAKNAQTALTAMVEEAKRQGIFYVQDFIDALNRAIRRKQFAPSVRTLYNIAQNDSNLPTIRTEAELVTWGQNVNDGETARIAAGGAPITFPSLADVNGMVGTFNSLNAQQANAKEAYDTAQEALAADSIEADKLILKMWNETETAFDEGDKASMRRKSREWGVVYVPNPGEVPSPDDYSIMGKITASITGNPLPDAVVHVQNNDMVFNADSGGNYFVSVLPAGTYTLDVLSNGYKEQHINAVVTTGAITTLNIQMELNDTGTIKGTVNESGVVQPATVSIAGTPVTTDVNGYYQFNDIPSGPVTVQAWLNSNPGNTQTQNVNLTAGGTLTVDFNF